jgi:uncharacterized protein (DUF1015 family)
VANIVPFRGLHYNPGRAGEAASLIAPPYDVIDEAAQKNYYERNPYNVIRLEYGQIRPTDDAADNRYTRASAFFARWLTENILTHEDKPSVYLYEQEFSTGGRRLTRTGLTCGVGVEEYETGIILPHEETLSKAKADRLELLRHCRANFSPIFGLYDDPCLAVETLARSFKEKPPATAFTDDNGEGHRLWVIDDPPVLTGIRSALLDKKVYIADGHHRYETALTFHREMSAAGDNRFGFVLMTLVNLHDPGLVILPTHRQVRNISNFNGEKLLRKLEEIFTVTSTALPGAGRDEVLRAELATLHNAMTESHAFLLYSGDGFLHRLALPRGRAADKLGPHSATMSLPWRQLDVAVLQCLVLENLLGIDRQARQSGDNLTYTREEAGALAAVDSGDCQAVFFMNPTGVHEVLAVASAGDKMPQKSTYFYPKLVTGLVINDFLL